MRVHCKNMPKVIGKMGWHEEQEKKKWKWIIADADEEDELVDKGDSMLREVEKKAMDESLLNGVEINSILIERSKHNERIGQRKQNEKNAPLDKFSHEWNIKHKNYVMKNCNNNNTNFNNVVNINVHGDTSFNYNEELQWQSIFRSFRQGNNKCNLEFSKQTQSCFKISHRLGILLLLKKLVLICCFTNIQHDTVEKMPRIGLRITRLLFPLTKEIHNLLGVDIKALWITEFVIG
jgi:hypothetical protein